MSICAATACGSLGTTTEPVEANQLGITTIAISHGDTNGDRVLTVRGLDQDDHQVAIATLRTGMVMYGADLPEAPSPGTELNISVGAASQTFVSPDREAHTIPAPASATLTSFVRLRDVANAIRTEAGIEFAPPASDEVAFTAGGCNGANFPTSKGSPTQCCQDGLQIWHKVPSGGTVNQLANRSVLASGGVCRTSAGNTGCVDSACTYGPCGAQPLTITGSNTTAAAVFHPVGAPTQCGRDSNGSVAGGGVEAPEAYTGSQSLYAAINATCPPYTACKSDGTPGIHITLTADCTVASGAFVGSASVTWNGNTVTCSFVTESTVSQTFWYPYNTLGTVTRSTNWFTGWSGTCTGTGACSGTWTSDVNVTGNFVKDTCPTC